ncbi:MAG: ABC transporter ATP-binding protein, partial [Deltaproteobacteria bacterium]|nr:ABC transporter ATP-binding protein [Deltaproteobacteria bacterium]
MMLRVKDLRVYYGGVEALKGISLDLGEREIISLVGSNGAGKSTTLRAISGLVKLAGGEIHFRNSRIDRLRPQEIVKLGIGHVPEGRNAFPYMTVLENLRLGAFLRKDRSDIERSLDQLFDHFPVLRERRRQQARTLSGGEQQMLVIARALMGRPDLLLMDEPSLGLAPVMVQEIGRIIEEINERGTSILLVEQNARLAL